MFSNSLNTVIRFFIFFLSVCSYVPVSAQDNSFLLEFGPEINRIQLTDKSFSSIPYIGANAGGYLWFQYQRKNSLHELNAGFVSGSLKSAIYPSYSLTNKSVNLDYISLHEINPVNDLWIFQVGGALNAMYVERDYTKFINNYSSFEFASSASFAAQVSHLFENKFQDFIISNRLVMPFVSLLVQPAFGASSIQVNNKSTSAKVYRFQTFGYFLRIKNSFSIEKKITDKQSLSLDYIFQCYRIANDRWVNSSAHALRLKYTVVL